MIYCEFLKVEEEKKQTANGNQIEKKKSLGRSNNNDDTTITHEDLIGCLPFLHFKNEEFKACVVVNDTNNRLFVASKCSNNNTRSFWVKKGMNHICSVYEHQCLTYNIDSSTGNVTLMRYNATSKYQHPAMDHKQ